jgi:hypothetical protein
MNVCGYCCGEPAISLHSYPVPLVQWSTRFLPVMRDPGSIPRGVHMWNRDYPVSIVLLHWWPWCDWLLWPWMRRASSRIITRQSCQQCDNPTWSHTAGFTLAAGPPSSFITDVVSSWGGALCRACNLNAFIHSSTGPEVHPFTFHHEGSGFNPQRGTYVRTKIILLTLSCYTVIFAFPRSLILWLLSS